MHYFLSRKNYGINRSLTGKVGIVYIFVNSPKDKWGVNASKNEVMIQSKQAAAFLEKEASKHGASLRIYNYYLEGFCSKQIHYESNLKILTQEIVKGMGYYGIGNMWAAKRQEENLDDVVTCFVLPGEDISFTHQSNEKYGEEYVILMGKAPYGTYIHEICHLYGAPDYYYDESVVQKVKRYFGGSIMNSSNEVYVDDLTAYIIGWDQQLSQNARAFLQETDYLTEKIWYEKLRNRIKTGKGKMSYPHGNYEGELYHGMPHGFGVMRYHTGDVYEGYFEKGLFCGQGKLVYATGDYYIGEFKNHTFNGKGTIFYRNGQVRKGFFRDGQIVNG